MVCGFEGMCEEREKEECASGSVVEYRLAKARVAGSNPVSRLVETVGSPEKSGTSRFLYPEFCNDMCGY